jgi:hypothetical protein
VTAVDRESLEAFDRTHAALGHRYRVERTVAVSAERVLFQAYDLALKRLVSLRINFYSDAPTRAWFTTEAEALGQLDHPAIRHLYDVGVIGDLAYRVGNWIDGEGLQEAVRRGPRLLPTVLTLARDLLGALEHAHTHGIIVRRIVPESVLLTPEGRGTITDLRFCSYTLPAIPASVAPPLPMFMAPEVREGVVGDPTADVYTVGALLYFAVTGQAPPAALWAARPIVMILDKDGDLCTGTALAQDLVLTAAHCVARKTTYEVHEFQTGLSVPLKSVARHPRFNFKNYLVARATADIALVKLAAPLPPIVVPAALAAARRVAPGETLTIAGFGTVRDGSKDGLGVPRMATLTVTGRPGSLQIRLVDPKTNDARAGQVAGLGACTGDSGGPAYDGLGPLVIGVVSWTTGPKDTAGCGGLTGLTPLLAYRGWIVETARKLGAPLRP